MLSNFKGFSNNIYTTCVKLQQFRCFPIFVSLQRAHTRVSVAGAKVIAWCCAGFMLHHTRMDTRCDDVTKVLLRLQGHKEYSDA